MVSTAVRAANASAVGQEAESSGEKDSIRRGESHPSRSKKTGDHEPTFHYNTSLTQAVRLRNKFRTYPNHPSSYTSDLRNLTHPKLHQVMTLPPSRVARNHPARGSRPTLHPGFRRENPTFVCNAQPLFCQAKKKTETLARIFVLMRRILCQKQKVNCRKYKHFA